MKFVAIIWNNFYLICVTVFSITIDLDYMYKVTETNDQWTNVFDISIYNYICNLLTYC